jgi:hypothetical protein
MKKLLFPILAALMLTVGCSIPGGPITITTSNQPPTAYIDSISPPEVSLGETVAFEGHGTDPEGTVETYRWRSSIDGDLSTKKSFETSSLSAGEHTIYLKVQDNNGAWSEEAQAHVTVSGGAVERPVINSFGASPGSISPGGSSTLSWNVSGATTVSIDQGVGSVGLVGSTAVSPAATITYTLTASNAAGSNTAATQVIVSGAPPPLEGVPVVNYFVADPPAIAAGDSTTLSWDVSNATSVTIDPGVGAVDSVGSISVSPAMPTDYTLTATNAAGWRSVTITVLVSGVPPPAGEPDLVITNIQRVETPEGYKINYTIKNQGTADVGASTTKLYASTVYKASDSVGLLAAGASETKQFTGWVFNPTTPIIKVVADADGAVAESDDTNNEKQVNYAIQILYNFVDSAGAASVVWKSGSPLTNLSFGGSTSDPNGFAVYRTSMKMEDGTTYGKVLETHPKWVNDGYIYGYYPIGHLVKPGEHFFAKVGLIHGASAGNVRFEASCREVGSVAPETLLISLVDSYDSTLKTIDVPLPPETFGKEFNFYLRVRANGSSAQDWAAWVEARIIR